MSQIRTDNNNGLGNNYAYDGSTLHTTKYETKVPSLHKFHIFFYSIIVALLSVATPFLTEFANNLQSQNLYVGMMLTKGQIPYSDIFTTGGMLYFVMIALSYFLGSTIWLVLVEVLCFYLAGVYFYKLVNYFASSQKIAATFTFLFFVMNLLFGFGGLYPIQFAMPLILVSLWNLTKYFAGLIKDEAFILLGIAGAMAMLIEPKTLVYFVLSSIAVIVFNSKNRHLARGFYQLLAALFGMLLIFYIAGYFILNLQILGPYFKQAFVYQFTNFNLGTYPLVIGILVQFAICLASGLLFGPIYFMKKHKSDADAMVKWVILASILIYLLMAVLSGDVIAYHQLFLLPFGLILTAVPIAHQFNISLNQGNHRRSRGKKGMGPVLQFYFTKCLYLPILLLVGLLTFQYMTISKEITANKERHQIVQTLKKKIQPGQAIYVWDTNSIIYQQTVAKSASHFASPVINTNNLKNKQMLYDELLQNKAKYIIVNKKLKVPEKVKKILRKNLKLDEKVNLSGFAIYKKK